MATDKPKRQSPFMVRYTVEERNEIDEAAQSESMPTGTWVRSITLSVARALKRKRAREQSGGQ